MPDAPGTRQDRPIGPGPDNRPIRPPRGQRGPDGLLSIAGAQALIAEQITRLPVERVGLAEAAGRFLAEDVRALTDLPPFASSAMDGYAVRSADTPGRLRVVGESAAGSPYVGSLEPGEAIAISTGAVVPAAVDAVVPVEHVLCRDATIAVASAVRPGAFVRTAGGASRRGSVVLAAGMRLGPAQIGAAAASGHHELSCARRPRVAVLSTGSELRQPGPGLELDPGQIYDANGPLLTAAVGEAGADVAPISAVGDDAAAQRDALREALAHDVVISSGGVSLGTHDLARGLAGELGVREVFWKVAVRPGKPIYFGVRGATLFFGLPGNPVSALVCFELFVRPALLALQGVVDARPAFRAGRLGESAQRNSERDELIRARVDTSGRTPVIWPLAGQESHQITIAAQADAIALVPLGPGELAAGADVAYLSLRNT